MDHMAKPLVRVRGAKTFRGADHNANRPQTESPLRARFPIFEALRFDVSIFYFLTFDGYPHRDVKHLLFSDS